MSEHEDQMDRVFRALACKPRREILRLLATGIDASRCCSPDAICACDLSDRLGIKAPTISHHMKALGDAGLVTSEKRAQWVYYRLRPEVVSAFASELMSLMGCEPSTSG